MRSARRLGARQATVAGCCAAWLALATCASTGALATSADEGVVAANGAGEAMGGAGGASVGASGSVPVPAARPSAAAGIYSETQAERGQAAFENDCSECHATGEFRGAAFQANWGRRTVYSLYRTVRSTMPDDNPGGLAEEAYLDVVAYILKMNGHSAGEADLTADSPMRDVRLATPEADL